MQQSRAYFANGPGERFAPRPKHQATNGDCTYKQFSTYTSLELVDLPCSLAPTSLPKGGPFSFLPCRPTRLARSRTVRETVRSCLENRQLNDSFPGRVGGKRFPGSPMPSACAENDPLLLSQFLESMTTVRRWRSAILLIIATWAVVSHCSFMGHDREWGIDLAAPEDFCKLDLASTTQLSSAPSNSWSRHWDLATTPSSVGKRQTGRITFDLRGTSFSVSTGAPELGTLNGTETSDDKSISQQYEQVSLSTDPASTIHLIHLLGLFSLNFGSAFMGTLRLLAPLYVHAHNKVFLLL